jgi:hypothetical protein
VLEYSILVSIYLSISISITNLYLYLSLYLVFNVLLAANQPKEVLSTWKQANEIVFNSYNSLNGVNIDSNNNVNSSNNSDNNVNSNNISNNNVTNTNQQIKELSNGDKEIQIDIALLEGKKKEILNKLGIYQSINLSINQSNYLYPSLYQSINLSIYQSIHLLVHQVGLASVICKDKDLLIECLLSTGTIDKEISSNSDNPTAEVINILTYFTSTPAHIQGIYLTIYLSIYLTNTLSIYLTNTLSIYLTLYLTIYVSMYL